MLSTRLSLALETGAVTLPAEGRIAVVGARAGTDLSDLPRDRLTVITRHFPDHRGFADAGYDVATSIEGRFALSIIVLPRAKAEARASIAAAHAATDGPLVIDGQKTDGVDSILKDLRKRTETGAPISKAHGKIFTSTGGDLSDWAAPEPTLIEGRFLTAPGAFSADAIDPGSRALAQALPAKLKGHVVDLGAGWGYLSDAILQRDGVTSLDLVESDHAALQAARRNITDPRAHFHWADALTFRPDARADHVVTNPPFHTGRAAEPALGQAFIRAAAALLAPRGQLWLVSNRHLPYEKTLQDAFRDVETLGQTPSFKLYTATAPRTPRKG
jgi:16S rRNA (guanine1207-N2)-methyltransferase